MSTRFSDVRWFDEIGSTNDWLMDQARAGAPEGLVAVADHQTAGRGRRDRVWVAPPGSSLLVSILLRPALPPERLQLVTAAVALSARHACQKVAGVTPELKWPNDLLAGPPPGRKLAGILAESLVSAGGVAVVVGMGLNLRWSKGMPEALAREAVSLEQLAPEEPTPDRETVLAELLVDLDRRVGDWDQVAADYQAACSTVGLLVSVDLGTEKFEGTALRVLPDGRLEIEPTETAEGQTRAVAAADVVHLRPTS